MNAILRETYEAHVLTNETIEVHLHYLRSGLDGVQAALPVLRDKIDSLAATVDSKIEKVVAKFEALNEKTNGRIDALEASATARFEETNAKMDAGFEKANARMDTLNARMEEGFEKASARMDTACICTKPQPGAWSGGPRF